MSQKSERIINDVIAATSAKDAVQVIKNLLAELHLSNEYYHLVNLREQMNEFTTQFKELENNYKELAAPRAYEDLHEIRVNLTFLYREISDALSFEVNKLKIYYEERKTVVRANSSLNLKKDSEFAASFKNLSESLLREYIGYDKDYDAWTTNVSVAYGLYQALTALLTSVKQLIDAIASEEKYLLTIKVQDVK